MTPPHPPLTPRSEALHLQIARNMRNAIEAGALRHEEVLPSTRDLAEEWGVSVFTISEAMKVLIDEGLVVSKSRSKRVVNSSEQSTRLDSLVERILAVRADLDEELADVATATYPSTAEGRDARRAAQEHALRRAAFLKGLEEAAALVLLPDQRRRLAGGPQTEVPS